MYVKCITIERNIIMAKHSNISGKAKAIAWLFTLVYFGSYMTRKNFDVMLRIITNDFADATKISTEEINITLSFMITSLLVSYGIGQVVCGFLGDKVKPQYMLTAGLAIAAVANVVIAIPAVSQLDNIVVMSIIWGINGFAHSMLWPPMVRIMSLYLNSDEYGYAAVRVSWGSQFATILLYLGCPALLELAGLMGLKWFDWRAVIILCAVLGIVINVLWNIFYPKLLSAPKNDAPKKTKDGKDGKKGVPLPLFVIIPLICIFFGIVFQGAMRDGITDWAPTLLDETFKLGANTSTVSAVVLAVFSIISFSAYDLVHRKLLKNEVFCAAIIFVFSMILSAIICLMFVLKFNSAILSIVLMAILVANMHGINLMLITVVPKRFIKSGKVSLFSGILNACTYVGSAVAIPVFAWLASLGYGWTAVVVSWIVLSLLGTIVLLIASPIWKKFCRKYADD